MRGSIEIMITITQEKMVAAKPEPDPHPGRAGLECLMWSCQLSLIARSHRPGPTSLGHCCRVLGWAWPQGSALLLLCLSKACSPLPLPPQLIPLTDNTVQGVALLCWWCHRLSQAGGWATAVSAAPSNYQGFPPEPNGRTWGDSIGATKSKQRWTPWAGTSPSLESYLLLLNWLIARDLIGRTGFHIILYEKYINMSCC